MPRRRRWYAASHGTAPRAGSAAVSREGTLGPMGRWREAAIDALAIFAASRVLVLAVLLVPPTRVHSYLTTWDAGFYLDIARCGYDPSCGAPGVGRAAGVLPAAAARGARRGQRRRSRRPGAEPCWRRSRAWRAGASAPALQRPARAPGGAAGLRGRVVLPVLVRAQHELLGGALPARLGGRLHRQHARAARHWHSRRALAAGLARPAAIPLAIGLAADGVLSRRSGDARSSRAPWARCGRRVVFADLERRRDDWLASLHAQQLGWQRSTSIVDAPGELAATSATRSRSGTRRTCSTSRACRWLPSGWSCCGAHGVRDGMFVFAAIAVVAPLATGSAMSLPRFLMGTFPYAVAGGLLLERLDPRWRAGAARRERRRARGLHLGDLSRQRACAVVSPSSSRSPCCTRARRFRTTADAQGPARRRTSTHGPTPSRTGRDAYGELDYEYPPATLPLLVAPLAAGGDDSGQAYHQRTIWLYGALDVGCVVLLAAFLRRRRSGELAAGARALQRHGAGARAARAHALRPGRGDRDPHGGSLRPQPGPRWRVAGARRGAQARPARGGARPDAPWYEPAVARRRGRGADRGAGRVLPLERRARALVDRLPRRPRSRDRVVGRGADRRRPRPRGARRHGLRPRQPEPDGHDCALARAALRARRARPARCSWHAVCAGSTPTARWRCSRRSACSSRSRPCSRPSTCSGSRRSRRCSPRATRCRPCSWPSPPCSRASSCAWPSTTCPVSSGARSGCSTLRNVVLVAFASCSGARLLRQGAEDLPGRLEPPVREGEAGLEAGRERPAHLLVVDQEPDQHLDARVRARLLTPVRSVERLLGQATRRATCPAGSSPCRTR